MNTKNRHIVVVVLVTLSISFIAFLNIMGDREINRGHIAPDTSKVQTDYAQLNNKLKSENIQLAKEVDTLKQRQVSLFTRMEELSQQITVLSASLDTTLASKPARNDIVENSAANYVDAVQNQEQQNHNYEISRQEKLVLLEEVFYNEDTEDSWSNIALDEINKGFEKLDDRIKNGVSLSHAECHSTICRLEINFDDENSDGEFFTNFALTLAWNATAFYERMDSPGENRSLIYLSRDGHALPINP